MKNPSFTVSPINKKALAALPTGLWLRMLQALVGVILAEDDYDDLLRSFADHGTNLSQLHVRIVGPAAALGRDPDDVLGRVLDVASFAMDAVLRVDLELCI